jgi:hypothetical protein
MTFSIENMMFVGAGSLMLLDPARLKPVFDVDNLITLLFQDSGLRRGPVICPISRFHIRRKPAQTLKLALIHQKPHLGIDAAILAEDLYYCQTGALCRSP